MSVVRKIRREKARPTRIDLVAVLKDHERRMRQIEQVINAIFAQAAEKKVNLIVPATLKEAAALSQQGATP